MGKFSDQTRLMPLYVKANYMVFFPEATVVLRVGLVPAIPRQWQGDWAWLTAVNPGSRCLSQQENSQRLTTLHEHLNQGDFEWFPALSSDPEGGWPDEPGCWVRHLSLAEGVRLARQYEQNAILTGQLHGAVELHWIAD